MASGAISDEIRELLLTPKPATVLPTVVYEFPRPRRDLSVRQRTHKSCVNLRMMASGRHAVGLRASGVQASLARGKFRGNIDTLKRSTTSPPEVGKPRWKCGYATWVLFWSIRRCVYITLGLIFLPVCFSSLLSCCPTVC
jgi:hypothetical protein